MELSKQKSKQNEAKSEEKQRADLNDEWRNLSPNKLKEATYVPSIIDIKLVSAVVLDKDQKMENLNITIRPLNICGIMKFHLHNLCVHISKNCCWKYEHFLRISCRNNYNGSIKKQRWKLSKEHNNNNNNNDTKNILKYSTLNVDVFGELILDCPLSSTVQISVVEYSILNVCKVLPKVIYKDEFVLANLFCLRSPSDISLSLKDNAKMALQLINTELALSNMNIRKNKSVDTYCTWDAISFTPTKYSEHFTPYVSIESLMKVRCESGNPTFRLSLFDKKTKEKTDFTLLVDLFITRHGVVKNNESLIWWYTRGIFDYKPTKDEAKEDIIELPDLVSSIKLFISQNKIESPPLRNTYPHEVNVHLVLLSHFQRIFDILEKHPHHAARWMVVAEQRYLRFMRWLGNEECLRILPPSDVLIFWHSHLLNPSDYWSYVNMIHMGEEVIEEEDEDELKKMEEDDDNDDDDEEEDDDEEDGFQNKEEVLADIEKEEDERKIKLEQAKENARSARNESAGNFSGNVYGKKKKKSKSKVCKVTVNEDCILLHYKKGSWYNRKNISDEYRWNDRMSIQKKGKDTLQVELDPDEKVSLVISPCPADSLEEFIWKHIWKSGDQMDEYDRSFIKRNSDKYNLLLNDEGNTKLTELMYQIFKDNDCKPLKQWQDNSAVEWSGVFGDDYHLNAKLHDTIEIICPHIDCNPIHKSPYMLHQIDDRKSVYKSFEIDINSFVRMRLGDPVHLLHCPNCDNIISRRNVSGRLAYYDLLQQDKRVLISPSYDHIANDTSDHYQKYLLGESATTIGKTGGPFNESPFWPAIVEAMRTKVKEVYERDKVYRLRKPYRGALFRTGVDLIAATMRQRVFTHKILQIHSKRMKMKNKTFLLNSYEVESKYERYLRFLALYKYDERRRESLLDYEAGGIIFKHPIVPTLSIDLFWHTGQLSATRYHRSTMDICGQVLNHNDNINDDLLGVAFVRTAVEYYFKYEELYTNEPLSKSTLEFLMAQWKKKAGLSRFFFRKRTSKIRNAFKAYEEHSQEKLEKDETFHSHLQHNIPKHSLASYRIKKSTHSGHMMELPLIGVDPNDDIAIESIDVDISVSVVADFGPLNSEVELSSDDKKVSKDKSSTVDNSDDFLYYELRGNWFNVYASVVQKGCTNGGCSGACGTGGCGTGGCGAGGCGGSACGGGCGGGGCGGGCGGI